MPSCGPGARKNGTSAPSGRASSWRRSAGSGAASVSLREHAAPSRRRSCRRRGRRRPGSACRSVARQRGSTPAAAASDSSARRTSVSSAKPSTASSPRRSSVIVSQRSTRWSTVATSCRPSSRAGPTTSARLIFAGARGAASRGALRRARRTRAARAPRRERPGRGRSPRAPQRPRSREATPGERERVGERLAAVGERRLDDALHAGRDAGARCAGTRRAPSRRSAAAGRPRARPDGSRCARSRAARAPRPRRRPSCRATAKKRSATSRCTITHHARDRRQAVEALDDERRGDVVRQVRDELRRRRLERRGSSASASSQWSVVRGRPAQLGLERAVELDRVHVRDAVGEVAGEDAEAGADLEHDVVGARARRGARSRRGCSRRRGSAGRAASSRRACYDAARLTARRRRRRSRRSAGRARRRSSPRASASTASVCTTYAGSLGRPRTGCGARYGLSVSTRRRSPGTLRGGGPELGRLRVGDVAGERDVPAALERRRRAERATRSSGGRRCRRSRASTRERVLVGAPRVDHDRLAELGGELELLLEEPPLRVVRGVVAEVVEPRLADGDGALVGEQVARARRAARRRRRRPRAGGCRGSRRRRRPARRARAPRGRPRSWSRR